MKKKYYDLYPETLSMVLTSVFSVISVVLLLISVNRGNGLVISKASSNNHAFLFTPAGFLVIVGCAATAIMSIESLRHPNHSMYILIPIGITGVLFALRAILVQGDVSVFLDMSGKFFSIALIRGILGIAVIILLFLLVTNVVPAKSYLIIVLGIAIAWYFGTETLVTYRGWTKELYKYDTSQSLVLLSQISYYFSILFYTFNLKQTDQNPMMSV